MRINHVNLAAAFLLASQAGPALAEEPYQLTVTASNDCSISPRDYCHGKETELEFVTPSGYVLKVKDRQNESSRTPISWDVHHRKIGEFSGSIDWNVVTATQSVTLAKRFKPFEGVTLEVGGSGGRAEAYMALKGQTNLHLKSHTVTIPAINIPAIHIPSVPTINSPEINISGRTIPEKTVVMPEVNEAYSYELQKSKSAPYATLYESVDIQWPIYRNISFVGHQSVQVSADVTRAKYGAGFSADFNAWSVGLGVASEKDYRSAISKSLDRYAQFLADRVNDRVDTARNQLASDDHIGKYVPDKLRQVTAEEVKKMLEFPKPNGQRNTVVLDATYALNKNWAITGTYAQPLGNKGQSPYGSLSLNYKFQ